MLTSKQILICMLVVSLVIAFVPLGGRVAAMPCGFMWRYAISYAPPAGNNLVPDYGFPVFPPRCDGLIPGYAGML